MYEGEEVEGKLKLAKSIIILSVILIGVFFYLGFNYFFGETYSALSNCGDGTFDETCSLVKPYYCKDRYLIEKSSVCGCNGVGEKYGESCIFPYMNTSKEIVLNYKVRGQEGKINYLVYEELYSYLANKSREIYYELGEKPFRADFKLTKINEENQRRLLMPLVVQIQNIAEDKDDQARIAISLVQNIPFGLSDKKVEFNSFSVDYSRYPYEVLYDVEGVCEEKSELLLFLLRELGFGVASFYYQPENHEAVGIKCPVEKSYEGTGYCFVETTAPAIITDSEMEFVSIGKLKSTPEIILISEGLTFGEDSFYEYEDAEDLEVIYKDVRQDGRASFFRGTTYNSLTEDYGLVKSYQP